MIRAGGFIGIGGRWGVWISLLGVLVAGGCIPVPSELGGTIPPPDINGDGSVGEEPEPPIDGDNGETMVFDVSISAASRNVANMTMDATLTVVLSEAGNIESIEEATLRDTENTFNGTETVGTVGGVFVTAFEGVDEGPVASFFDLSVEADGTVTAQYTASGAGSSDPNVFILPDGDTFRPGEIGVTYRLQTASSYSFRIEGDSVSGELDLNGTPASTAGTSDFYMGTFEGQRRP